MKRVFVLLLSISLLLSCAVSGLAEPGNSIIIEDLGKATEEELNSAVQKIYEELEARKASAALVDDKYITVEFLNFDEMPDMCFYVNLSISNKTEKTIWVTMDEASVNNETMQLIMTGIPVNILPGQKGKGTFIFMYQQLSIKSLSEVNDVKFKINVHDESSMKTIEHTGTLTVVNSK